MIRRGNSRSGRRRRGGGRRRREEEDEGEELGKQVFCSSCFLIFASVPWETSPPPPLPKLLTAHSTRFIPRYSTRRLILNRLCFGVCCVWRNLDSHGFMHRFIYRQTDKQTQRDRRKERKKM